MLEASNGPLTFIRFGIQRKKDFLRDVKKAYNGLVLPGNILLYQYRSTPSVIFMCEKPFFVDPMSYLFGQPYEDFKQRVKKENRNKFKPSFEKLMKGHGLNPDHFIPYRYTKLLDWLMHSENLSGFVDHSLHFQWCNVWDTIQEAKELMTDGKRLSLNESDYRPCILIPPYFLYARGRNGRRSITTELNAQILEYCWENKSNWGGDLFPMVFIKKEDLEDGFRDEIISIVKKHSFPGYCVWVEDFDERYVTESQVKGLIRITQALSQDNRQVLMLYGGFFSMLLYHFGMSCICHGLAYGEARKVSASAQQGSGPAPVRYYILELHRFFTLEDALLILRERNDLICSCLVCRRVIGNNPERVTRFAEEATLAEMHFLWNRSQEKRMILDGTVDDLINNLEWSLVLNEDICKITKLRRGLKGFEECAITDIGYIKEWKSALESTHR